MAKVRQTILPPVYASIPSCNAPFADSSSLIDVLGRVLPRSCGLIDPASIESFQYSMKHWKIVVTGGFVAVGLWLLHGMGRTSPPSWVNLGVSARGISVARYHAWVDQHQRGETVTQQLKIGAADRRLQLVRAITTLQGLQTKVIYWRDVANGRWEMAKPAEKLQLDNLPTILYEAGKIKPDLGMTMEAVEWKVNRAESLIAQYISQQPANKDERLMKRAYTLLDEAAPQLSNVLEEFEAAEKRLR